MLCQQCKIWYPVYSYIPAMLVFETQLHKLFARDYAGRFELLSEYSMPNRLPEPGEKSIQETFTGEWNCVQDNELSFLYSLEDLKLLHGKVLLNWIEYSQEEIRNVLDVGCGLGHKSISLQCVKSSSEIFAIDRNFAVLKSGELFQIKTTYSLDNFLFITSSFEAVFF